MSRLKEFDPDLALQKAMTLFWCHGFGETSVRELVKSTGVARAGLYAEFGGKEGLYLAALDKYVNTILDMLCREMEKPTSGRNEVMQFFTTILAGVSKGTMRNGCMVVNARVEFSGTNSNVNKIVIKAFDRMRLALQGGIERAKATGDVNPDINPEHAALSMTNTFHGLMIQSRSGTSIEELRIIAKAALTQLD